MPWRLVITLIIFGIILAFIGFNLDHKADISFGFYTFHQIPVFVSLFISFIIGALLMVPFTIGKRKRKNRKKDANSGKGVSELPSSSNSGEIPEKKKGFLFSVQKKKEQKSNGKNEESKH